MLVIFPLRCLWLCQTFMLRHLLRIGLWSTVQPYVKQKFTWWGKKGSWRARRWWVEEYFDILWLRRCLNCKMFEDEVIQEDCWGAASACCSLKAGKPGDAADPGTGHALINRAPSHRPWSRQAEPEASNLLQGPARETSQRYNWKQAWRQGCIMGSQVYPGVRAGDKLWPRSERSTQDSSSLWLYLKILLMNEIFWPIPTHIALLQTHNSCVY